LQFETINELNDIFNSMSEDKYNNMLFAIQDNFERAKQYCIVEDWLFENLFCKL
jgi:hypothetical protein